MILTVILFIIIAGLILSFLAPHLTSFFGSMSNLVKVTGEFIFD